MIWFVRIISFLFFVFHLLWFIIIMSVISKTAQNVMFWCTFYYDKYTWIRIIKMRIIIFICEHKKMHSRKRKRMLFQNNMRNRKEAGKKWIAWFFISHFRFIFCVPTICEWKTEWNEVYTYDDDDDDSNMTQCVTVKI